MKRNEALTAYIGYGFMEGPRHGRRMRIALQNRGHNLCESPHEADLIIAHSGAHLLLPEPREAQQTLLIDASYDTGRTVIDNVFRHIWYDLVHVLGRGDVRYYAWKTGWNLVYFFTRHSEARQMYERLRMDAYTPLRFGRKTIITQSDDMSWYNPDVVPGSVIRINLDHDDCWRHPERYLDLLEPTS